MRSGARRALAVAIVGGSLGLALAVSATTVTPSNPHMNGVGKIGSPARIVASIRNTGTTATKYNVAKVAGPGNCPASVTVAPLAGSFPTLVAAGKQVEIVISSPGFTAQEVMIAQPSCAFDVTEVPATGTTIHVTANFSISTMGTPIDPQATALVLDTTEIQTIVVSSTASTPLAGVTAVITGDPDGRVSFAGGSAACGGHSCGLPAIAVGEAFDVPVSCAGGSAAVAATIAWTSGSAMLDQLVTCNPSAVTMGEQIALDTTALAIVSSPGTLQTAKTMVTSSPLGNDKLVAAAITGADAAVFAFPGLACTQQTCDLHGASALALPYPLVIGCTPDAAGVRNATLTVTGASGTQATALVSCSGNATGGPVLQVSSPTIAIPIGVPVGMASAPVPFTLTNAGAGTLTASIAVQPPANAEWMVSACTASAPCMLVGHGSATTVEVTLTPTEHGDRNGEMVVTSNDPAQPAVPINLVGTGSGGFLQVIEPPTEPLVFGAIPSTQVSEIAVKLLDRGNAPLAVAIAPPASPFSASVGNLVIAANQGTNTFLARCGPGAAFAGSGDFVLTSAAYNAPMLPIHASCTLVDAGVTVVPTRFDFGELRVGSPEADQMFTLTNITNHDVSLDALAIANGPAVLSLAGPSTPRTLHPNEAITGKLALAPTADLAFDRDVALGATVDGAALALPITGRVVTPHAVVSPIALDLGTACVGSTVSGTIELINDGTATLALDSPTIDEAFVPHDLSPVAYPAPLLAGTAASVEVVPATTAAGAVHGVLTWPVDVPSGAFEVPVDLEYIDAGTAVSPRRYAFDTIAALATSERRAITIENCGAEPIDVAVDGVTASQGDPAAWDLQPQAIHRTLLPQGTMKLLVRFAPRAAGSFRATIPVRAGTQVLNVELIGNATGPLDQTGFYACSCAAPGHPAAAWPIVVVVLALRRRRAVTCRRRCGSS